jgi:hypothetical protein
MMARAQLTTMFDRHLLVCVVFKRRCRKRFLKKKRRRPESAVHRKKIQACKSEENMLGVDDTLLYHQNTYDLLWCFRIILWFAQNGEFFFFFS